MSDIGLKRSLKIIMAVACIIICSHLSFVVPISETGIPITGQSFAISLVVYFLGLRDSLISIAIYLMMGIVGLPVYADGASGIEHLLGKSGGYLYGFLIAAFVMNFFHIDYKNSGLFRRFIFFVLITVYILLIGMIHLSFHIGPMKAYLYGVQPFLVGGLIKIFLAFGLTLITDISWKKTSGS